MAKAYYIPNGPENLKNNFPTLNFNDVDEYYLQLVDSTDVVIATTPINKIGGCENDDDKIRIHFLNYLGTIDAFNFKRINVSHEPTSDEFQQPIAYPLDKTAHGHGRFNVKSNDIISAVNLDYGEEEKDWMDELFDAPLAWVEKSIYQGQLSTFIPIVIIDTKRNKVKQDDRFLYQVQVDFKMSHERFIIRN
jgi:hypothetical protein